MGPFLKKKKNTNLKILVFVETRVAIYLTRIGSGNGQLLIGGLYGVEESTISTIVRKFCKGDTWYLQRVFVQVPCELQFRILARQFEALHDIPYILRAIDGSHISVLPLVIGR